MVLAARQYGCVSEILDVVSILSVGGIVGGERLEVRHGVGRGAVRVERSELAEPCRYELAVQDLCYPGDVDEVPRRVGVRVQGTRRERVEVPPLPMDLPPVVVRVHLLPFLSLFRSLSVVPPQMPTSGKNPGAARA